MLVVDKSHAEENRLKAETNEPAPGPITQTVLNFETTVDDAAFEAMWAELQIPEGQAQPMMSRDGIRHALERYLVHRGRSLAGKEG